MPFKTMLERAIPARRVVLEQPVLRFMRVVGLSP